MELPVAKRLQHTEEYYFSRKLRRIEEMNKAGANVINLGIGSPDLPPHPSVVEACKNHAFPSGYARVPGIQGHSRPAAGHAGWYERFYGVTLHADTEVLPLIGSMEGSCASA